MAKKKSKKSKKENKNLKIPHWFLDGFVGLLALMIYNFCLYILAIAFSIGGALSKMENTMGYFLLNSFVDFGFTTFQMTIGLLLVFVLSFVLGLLVGRFVRKKRGI